MQEKSKGGEEMIRKMVILLCIAVLAGSAFFATGGQAGDLTKMTFITPRGTVEVMDDYNLWVAIKMGYFEDMGLDVMMEPGPIDAFACTKFVDQGKADIGYPSPGVLTASVDTGMNVIMAYEMMVEQVFDFAVRKDSPIKDAKEIAGKTISVADAGWQVIIDPILVELGIDPKSVEYVPVGAQWGQAVAMGKADVALTWKGLRAQWDAQGLNLRYFLGEDFSKMPANGYCARKTDLTDPAKRALVEKFLRGSSMGIHFGRHNPRGAAQIVYDEFAAVREQMTPELALKSMQQLHWGYTGGDRKGDGYGWFEMNGWNTYLDIIADLGQTKKRLPIDQVATNDLIKAANDFDRAKVEGDAKSFKLSETWKGVEVTGNW
jgi:NitT/TauT family transport system substrate-binding protein